MPAVIFATVAVCVGALVVAALSTVRVRALARRPGAFACGMRRGNSPDWSDGVAHYGVTRINWWRCWSLSLRPAASFRRSALTIVSATPLTESDEAGRLLVNCRCDGVDFAWTMSGPAFEGLSSWLEAGSGHRLSVV